MTDGLSFMDQLSQERFWRRVVVKRDDECWLWIGGRRKDGYGIYGGRTQWRHARSHRIAWSLTNGPIPDGLFVCHHCDNPPCCNPAHLFLGTHEDNQADKVRKGRAHNANTGKLICKRGHNLLGDNVYINRRGQRACRECERARNRKWYHENGEMQRARTRKYHHEVRKHRRAA